MKTRMEKYYGNNENLNSRSEKNNELYKEVSKVAIDDFNPNDNVKIIGEGNIDIDKLKEMLDKEYREEPKKRKLDIDDTKISNHGVNLDETREYDINTILDKAKEEKEENYDIDRYKKVRDTQFDILNNLELTAIKEKEEKKPDEELMDLINTITINEQDIKNKTNIDVTKEKVIDNDETLDPLDILTDLKGSENTVVLEGLKENVSKSLNDVSELLPLETKEEKIIFDKTDTNTNNDISKQITEAKNKNIQNTQEIDRSLFTNSMTFTQSDFDDFNDLKEDMKSSKVVIKILTALIILAFIAGVVVLLNKLLGWGLF